MARETFRMSLGAGEAVKGGPRGLTGASWDGPVEIEYDMDVNKAKKLIRKQLKAGPLARSIRAARVIPMGGVPYLNVWSSRIYSEIQDQGGTIPPFEIIGGSRKGSKGRGRSRYKRVMVFKAKDGTLVFTTKRKGFVIKAKNYVQDGVDKWAADRGGIMVGWKGVNKRRLPRGD